MAKNNESQWGDKLPTVKPTSTTGKYRKSSALEDGQSITGTLLAIRTEFVEKLKKEVTSLVMKDDNNQTFELSPSGNINDAIRAGQLKIGMTYKFQKEGVEKTKKGQYKGVFGIYPSKNPPAQATANDDI